jgi:CRP-like cAMP-binding protein
MPFADSPSRPRILVIEDSYLTAAAVCDMVIKCGYEVAGTVGRLESGLEFVREHPVDGAVVDIDLHGTASFPICEQLKKRDIPFLFLTGYDRPYPMPEEFKTAPWLPKPVDHREFGVALSGLARTAAAEAGRGNLVLERLAIADLLALQPRLERVSLSAGEILIGAHGEVTHLHFPITALVSICARSDRGKAVEVALVGRDGITGVGLMLGNASSPGLETMVHVAGTAWRIAVSDLALLLEQRSSLRAALLEAVHEFLAQISETAVSIGSATIEQRLARRLLMVSLRLGSRQLALTHEALAQLLAVRRSGITVALHMLEARRVISSRRNRVEILDYEGLVRVAGSGRLSCTEAGASPSR